MRKKGILLLIAGTIFLFSPLKGNNIVKHSTIDGNLYIDIVYNENLNIDNFFTELNDIFSLSQDETMSLLRSSKSQDGASHYWFQLCYQAIPIEGAEYIIHTDSLGVPTGGNGKIIKLTDKEKTQAKEAKEVLQKESKIKSSQIKQKHSQLRTPVTESKLVFTRINDNLGLDSTNITIAFKTEFEITNQILDNIYIYVDPISLKEIKKNNASNNASVKTLYDGDRTISTKINFLNTSRYYTLEQDIVATGNMQAFYKDGPTPMSSPNDIWETVAQKITASAYWAVGQASEYFWGTLGRRGIDGNSRQLEIRASYGNKNNSSFKKGGLALSSDADMIVFGEGDSYYTGNWASIDIAGHEYTHGVIVYTANLNNSGESGALAESICDIFGCLIREHNTSYNSDVPWYIIGGNVAKQAYNGYCRSLREPKRSKSSYTEGMPNTYKGQYWASSSLDNGGIHVNGGVLNYWAYLLCAGGSGVNDNSHSYSVTAIPKPIVAKILYNSLFKLTSTSTYKDMRTETLMYAITEYGDCSFIYNQLEKAWDAVGVPVSPLPYSRVSRRNVCGEIGRSAIVRHVSDIIISPVNCSNSKIKTGVSFDCRSRSSIEIKGSFEVEAGATFSASIYQECD